MSRTRLALALSVLGLSSMGVLAAPTAAFAAGSPPPTTATSSSSCSPYNATCNAPPPKTMDESKLYSTLQTKPSSISRLVFDNGQNVVEVYEPASTNPKQPYDVSVAGDSDKDSLRALALTKKVDFAASGDIDSSSKTMDESQLYADLTANTGDIARVEFVNGRDEVKVYQLSSTNPEQPFIAGTSDSSDQSAIRQLLVKDGIAFSTITESTSSGGSPLTGFIVMGSIMFSILLLVILLRELGFMAGGITPGAGARREKRLEARAARQANSGTMMGGGGAAAAISAKHNVVKPPPDDKRLTWDDYVGQADARREGQKIVRFFLERDRARKKGAKVPRGVLLMGDSGEGKTYWARILSHCAKATFIHINCPDLIEKFVGVGASRLDQAFKHAISTKTPTIIFLDEIDAIGRSRKGTHGNGDESNQTLTKLLTLMDGFKELDEDLPIIVIAATNDPQALDGALLQRFRKKVRFRQPPVGDLIKLYELYARALKRSDDVDFAVLAKHSVGLSARMVTHVCEEAPNIAAFEEDNHDDDPISMANFEEALQRIIREAVSEGKGKRFHADEHSSTLADVKGQPAAVEDVMDIRNYMRDPAKYRSRGAKVPKGVLMSGPPGTGKTMIARSLANDCGVPFFSISASELVEEIVGRGAKHVREFFEQLRRNAPCIGFIDEIDAVGGQRGVVGSHDEREQTLNQLLTEMDGIGTGEDIVILAATNQPDKLDKALTRPGRFDRKAKFYKPTREGRFDLFKLYARDKQLAADVDLMFFARDTQGATGAEISNYMNEAALLMVRKDMDHIDHALLQEAILRCEMGAERKGIMSPHEIRQTAIHELGHTFIYVLLSKFREFSRITVVSRENALGHFARLNDDKVSQTKEEMRIWVAVALAGRLAQVMMTGQEDTGAMNDYQQARGLVRQMLGELNMDPELGILTEIPNVQRSAYEEELIAKRSKEVLNEITAEVTALLEENRGRLAAMVDNLIERETLSDREFFALFDAMNPDGSPVNPGAPVTVPPVADAPAPAVVAPPATIVPPARETPPVPPRQRERRPSSLRPAGQAIGGAIGEGIRRLRKPKKRPQPESAAAAASESAR